MCADMHQCRAAATAAASQEQKPRHYNDTKARVETTTKKGPASLKGLVNFSGSGPPGFLGLPKLPKPKARPSLKN